MSRRPHARRDRRHVPLLAKVLVTCSLLCAVGFGAYLGWRHLTGAQMARDEISAAIGDLASSDDAILPMDQAVNAQVGDYSADELTRIRDDATEALGHLDSAEARVRTIRSLDEFLNDEDRAVVDAMEKSIAARRELVDLGTDLLDEELALIEAQGLLDDSLAKALEADEHVASSVEAAGLYALSLSGQESEVSDPNVPVQHDNDAATALKEAQDLLAQAKERMPEADYSAYEDYYAKRASAVAKLLEADTAVAGGDYDGASSLVEEYNAFDGEAAAAAEAIPSDSTSVFEEAYVAATAQLATDYGEAFERTAAADAEVRAYQGLSVVPSSRA